MSITELSVKRPTLVVVVFSILVLLGLVGYQSLTMELLPKISAPVITIATIYPGASPGEVESSVTKKIEDAVSTLENLESNPKLWPQMAKEASTALAKKMILYTNKTTRTAAAPLM